MIMAHSSNCYENFCFPLQVVLALKQIISICTQSSTEAPRIILRFPTLLRVPGGTEAEARDHCTFKPNMALSVHSVQQGLRKCAHKWVRSVAWGQ